MPKLSDKYQLVDEYGVPMPTHHKANRIIIDCLNCLNPFEVTPAQSARKFCGRKCYGHYWTLQQKIGTCLHCSKEFIDRQPYPQTFCSQKCYRIHDNLSARMKRPRPEKACLLYPLCLKECKGDFCSEKHGKASRYVFIEGGVPKLTKAGEKYL